jgi:hypothetical protein
MTLQAWQQLIYLNIKRQITVSLVQSVTEYHERYNKQHTLCSAPKVTCFSSIAVEVEVLMWMRDPARSPCKVGKMEEEEGMLMWPLPPLPYAALNRY